VGIELELAVLLAVQLVGTEVFAPFEVETPAWREGRNPDPHSRSYSACASRLALQVEWSTTNDGMFWFIRPNP